MDSALQQGLEDFLSLLPTLQKLVYAPGVWWNSFPHYISPERFARFHMEFLSCQKKELTQMISLALDEKLTVWRFKLTAGFPVHPACPNPGDLEPYTIEEMRKTLGLIDRKLEYYSLLLAHLP